MVGSPVVPCIPSIPSSSVSLTVLVSECLYFETSRIFSGCLCCQTDGTGCPKCFQMDTSFLGLLSFLQFLYEKVGSSDCLTDDGVYRVVSHIIVGTTTTDDCCHGGIKECCPLLFCSFFYNDFLKVSTIITMMLLHSY